MISVTDSRDVVKVTRMLLGSGTSGFFMSGSPILRCQKARHDMANKASKHAAQEAQAVGEYTMYMARGRRTEATGTEHFKRILCL